ncbi:6-bladed beta-propeller [Algoriphagus sp. D3-2-R+10]|uniref:6-bladed beta-propeller n=1 Tax=Algoriphagus aurantiacus TaxID=3103948 RepID=UPI002B3A2C16|nr:6-bladed beta-propeller [Algoriphagus sp. D3-2-R+10]MEB2775912.1 6-bladed beta-propeller [Algoriphagus sp. D3-2-R+10]
MEIPKSSDPDIKLSDLAKSIDRIQLETSPGSFISSVMDVKQNNGKLYVRDVSGKVLIFDNRGKSLGKLGSLGDGPGEYSRAYSLTIDEKSGKVYLGSVYKLLVYSSDHEFLSERKFTFFVTYLSVLNGEPVIITDRRSIPVENGYATQNLVFQLDKSLDIRDSVLFRNVILNDKSGMAFTSKYFISNNNEGSFLYTPVLTPENFLRDTLYKFTDTNLTPAVKLKIEQPHLDENGEKIVKIYNIMNGSSYLICQYARGQNKMLFIYDKKSNIGHNLKGGVIDDDGEPVVLYPLDLEQDIFYFIKTAEYVDGDTEELNPTIGIVELK